MSQIKTAISIREGLFQETETIAQELNIPRSQVVAMALEEFVRRYRNRKLFEQINDAYAPPPSDDERESLEIMRSHQKKLMRDGEWS
jgi:metal-responsive CopG/Arc/MetJ family transcriptional regulator